MVQILWNEADIVYKIYCIGLFYGHASEVKLMNDTNMKKVNYVERLVQIAMAALVLVVFIIFARGIETKAADSAGVNISIVEINYENSTMKIMLNTKDTMLYLATGTQKKWEYVPVALETGVARDGITPCKYATMDISWISLSKNTLIKFRGDYSTEPVSVTIPKQITNLRATYDVYNSRVNFTNAGAGNIEWKKRDAFKWQAFDATAFERQLANMTDNGAVLQFRIAAENGTGSDPEDVGHRASKEVSVSIPKKTAAPVIVVDDSKMCINLKKGIKYRIVDENGNPAAGAEWTTVARDGEVLLENIAADAIYRGDPEVPAKDVYIQFYQAATSTTQMSKRKTVKIPAQEPLTAADLSADNTFITYTGKSNFELHFKTAGESNNMEYCIITKNMQDLGVSISDLLDDNIKWTTVQSSAAITKSKDSDSKLVDGSLIYFRRKAQGTLGDKNYKLASPVQELARLDYPEGADKDDLTILRTIEGMVKNGANNLYFQFSSDTEGKVEKIEFRNESGGMGTATFKDNVTKEDGRYYHNITITDLSDIRKTRSILYAYIYTSGQDLSDYKSAALQSDATKGVALYIYPKTVVNNPENDNEKTILASKLMSSEDSSVDKAFWSNYSAESDKIGFTRDMKRVYLSDRTDEAAAVSDSGISMDMVDQTKFRFVLDMGTLMVPEIAAVDSLADATDEILKGYVEKYGSEKVCVDYIKYDNVKLDSSSYKVEYYDTNVTDTDEYDYRTAVVTLRADVIERDNRIDDRDKETPVYIYLTNGEVLKSEIKLDLQRTAVAKPTSIAFTEGNREPYKITKTTDASGAVTESKDRNIDEYEKIELTIPANLGGKTNYDVGVKTVTWDGVNILYKAIRSDNTMVIILDSELLNTIDVETSKTCDIRIEMTNGYVISNGIPMTVNPAPVVTP